ADEPADVRLPCFVDGTGVHLVDPGTEAHGERRLGKLRLHLTGIPYAPARRCASLENEAVGHPRVDVIIKPVPVIRHVTIVAGEREVIVHGSELVLLDDEERVAKPSSTRQAGVPG